MKFRSIHLILALGLLNQSSSKAVRVLLALYALKLGAQPVVIGILASTFSVFPMLLSVLIGRLADRFGSRWLLVLGAVGGGLGMLVPYFFSEFFAIFIAAAILGSSSSIYNVSLQNLVGIVSNEQNRAQNFSSYSLTISVSNFLGPLIAGFSIDHSGHSTACLYLACFTLVPIAALMIWGSRLPRQVQSVERSQYRVGDMLSEPKVRKTLITSSLLHSGGDLLQFYLPVYAHAIGLSASATGIILAMNSAAAFVVRTVMARLIAWLSEEKVLVYAFLMGAASVALIPLVTNGTMLAVLAFVFGLGMGCGQPIVTMLMFSNAPAGRSGEALGLRMTVNHFSRLITPVIFGSVGSAFGIASAFWLNALMLGSGAYSAAPKK